MIYIFSFLSAIFLSFVFAIAVKKFAFKFGITDNPEKSSRKIHSKPIPLLGGFGVFLSFVVVVAVLSFFSDFFPSRYVSWDFLSGIFVSGIILMIGGYLDDRYSLSPKVQFLFPVLAVLVILGSGVGIEIVGNPIGSGVLRLDIWQFEFSSAILSRTLTFVLIADIFIILWLLGTSYTTKFLDGLDGLVSGIGAIGAVIIFALSLTDKTFQPDIALLSIIFAGALIGFLFWNIHPARMFLGEGGSLWVGFMLGLLAIISGGKIATALLILGIPILDVAWVITRRLFFEKKSPTIADSKHLHFRLLLAGFSHKKAVFLLWGFSAFFGSVSLLFQTKGKTYLLVVLILVMLILGLWVTRRSKKFFLP